MKTFIAKLLSGEIDESVHKQFVRFGKGKFESRALINFDDKGKGTIVKTSFEFATDMAKLVAQLAPDVLFSGIVMSKQELMLEKASKAKKKQGLYVYDVSELTSKEVMEIVDKVYCLLLDANASSIELKTKKRLPKPGKSTEMKITPDFCLLKADAKYKAKILEAFALPECKKARVMHSYIIKEIILPSNTSDPEEIRLKAKRKGKVIREAKIDGEEIRLEKNFVA